MAMRRNDREITERAEIEAIIGRAQVCRLGLCAEGIPYIVPMCFGYREGHVYMHSAPEGRKLDMVARNDRVCVEFEADCELVPSDAPCRWSMRYRSVIGTGRARMVECLEEKQRAFDVIMSQYGGSGRGIGAEALARVAVIEVVVESLTGKASGHDRESA